MVGVQNLSRTLPSQRTAHSQVAHVSGKGGEAQGKSALSPAQESFEKQPSLIV